MIELKFRAWDKANKVMTHFSLRNMVSIGVIWFDSDVEWMQYTGLPDYSGQDIYEKDIGIITDYIEGIRSDLLVVVYWNNMESKFELYSPEFDRVVNFNIMAILKVIGNVCENPELLKKGE